MKNKYQNILMTLSNGQQLLATVPAFCEEGKELKIVDVKVTEPLPLPEGTYWQDAANNGVNADKTRAA